MGVSVKQSAKVAAYVLKQRLLRRKRYPLVLMLEPLLRCNLACAGCGKIQYPDHVLDKRLTPEECWEAVEECGAPVVSIAGGEPLIHPEIGEIVRGYVRRKRFVYLCTNAILLERRLHLLEPSDYLTLSVHLDGLEERHDQMVDRKGVFQKAVKAIRAAKAAGFKVMTNTTVFRGEDPAEIREFFDMLKELGIDGMMISPGYSYEKAPQQELFLQREQTVELFQQILDGYKERGWDFNHSPFFLEFLMGKHPEYDCTPWGNPTRTVFGWQKPCYLLGEGYARTFKELMEETEWAEYGLRSGNPKCQNCMVHSGWEATAVNDHFASPKKSLASVLSG
ncbi:MAG: adenosyl-hopene transferase HpnH [Planctomycetota bacterium]|nr:MAG: adenosyl-hopene transferase HpnH [Planctomycetota bacterium]